MLNISVSYKYKLGSNITYTIKYLLRESLSNK